MDINDVILQFCQENKITFVDINTNVTKQKFAILASISKFKYLFNKLVLFKCECNFHLFLLIQKSIPIVSFSAVNNLAVFLLFLFFKVNFA